MNWSHRCPLCDSDEIELTNKEIDPMFIVEEWECECGEKWEVFFRIEFVRLEMK